MECGNVYVGEGVPSYFTCIAHAPFVVNIQVLHVKHAMYTVACCACVGLLVSNVFHKQLT